MATTDVTISSSLGEAIGATITLQVGAVPSASVDLRPSGGGVKVEGGGSFPDIDSRRRQGEEFVDISVRVRKGSGGEALRKFSFKGLLDGYSVSNIVGNNSYQAVLKNNAQSLLEVTTLMPGLFPSSVNIYKIPSHALTTSSQGDESETLKLWTALLREDQGLLKLSPVKFYVELLKLLVRKQQDGWQDYLGKDPMISGQTAFKEIFSNETYKKNLVTALSVLDGISYEGCSGMVANLTMQSSSNLGVFDIFAQGPTILFENLLNYLSSIGCSMIFGNNKSYIVPVNSVIKQDNYTPGQGQLSTSTNQAGPADYNSYSFNDIGFRDVNSVILMSPRYSGGANLGGIGFDRAVLGCFSAPVSEAKGSGVYITRAHPWMSLSAIAPQGTDAKEGKSKQDGSGSPYDKKMSFKDASKETGKSFAEREQKKGEELRATPGETFKNFAETKYYQARFTDRQGSITLDFNPNWAPGTGGELFVRESGMHLHFYVTSVTHHVETGPPMSGSALTIINFNCGRFGKSPAGSTGDEFLGYNSEVEKSVRSGYAQSFQ
jgi:hypothetical protein